MALNPDAFSQFHVVICDYHEWYCKPGNNKLSIPNRINQLLNEWAQQVATALISTVTNKHDKFFIEPFQPYFGQFGGSTKITTDPSKLRLELSFSYDGYELCLEPTFWPEIRAVDSGFFLYLSQAAMGGKLVYSPNQVCSTELEQQFSLSFKKGSSSPIFRFIRDMVLLNDDDMEYFNLMVRFDTIKEFAPNAVNCFKNLYDANYLLYRGAYRRQYPKRK